MIVLSKHTRISKAIELKMQRLRRRSASPVEKPSWLLEGMVRTARLKNIVALNVAEMLGKDLRGTSVRLNYQAV